MCPSLAAWALIAACHLGWAVPTDSTPMPEAKSMYSLPSRSYRVAPVSYTHLQTAVFSVPGSSRPLIMLSAPALFPGYAQLAPFFFKILAIYSNFLLTNSAAQITIVTKL